MQSVSIIICAYTGERWSAMVNAVGSVLSQSAPPDEIILVIDHNPALYERACAHFSGPVRVVENVEQKGLSGARNSGIAAARGDVIAFMDEDATASPDWLARLMEKYQGSGVLGAGGAVQPVWMDKRPGWFPQEFDWVVGCTYRGMPEQSAPVRNLVGCNMSFRRDVIEATGRFQDGIGRVGVNPMGCEETEFSIRAGQLYPGGQILFDPEAKVHHLVPASRASLRYFIARCYAEGRSKALISRLVGRQKSLSSEWSYTRQTLPAGVLQGLRDTLSGHPSGLARAGAIVLGLAFTGLGFLVETLAEERARKTGRGLDAPEAPAQSFEPGRVVEMEIGSPLKPVSAADPRTDRTYRRAMVLVRLHGDPLGGLELPLPENGLEPAEAAARIWQSLRGAINAHLRADGLPEAATLTAAGLVPDEPPRCRAERSKALAANPLVSVVIATRDRLETLVPTLETLWAQDYQNFELIVVDSAPSGNATADYLQKTYGGNARVRYICEPTPGLAVAHNRALLEVRGEIAAFTDDDVLLDRGWLSAVVADFNRDERVACVTGMILPVELETPAQGWIEQFGGFGKGFDRRVYDLEHPAGGPLFPYSAGMFGSGANMSFRVRPLCAMGGFDPALGAGSLAKGGDDLASFFDILTRGWRLVYEPGAVLYHRHRREYEGLRRQSYGYGVGLAAYLTKTILDQPARIFALALKVPAGLVYLLSPKSSKNRKKRPDYPRELSRLELKGFAAGPLIYLRSRWHSRPARQVAARLIDPTAGTGD